MDYDDFISRVQERAQLKERNQAVGLTQAVLETLGERLDRKVRNGVTAQLPPELKGYLTARNESSDHYDIHEFYNRIGARAGLNTQDAPRRTWEAFSVLTEAIPEGEKQDLLAGLPEDFRELFGWRK